MLVEVVRRVLYRRRVDAAQAWRDAARRDAAARNQAFQRIVAQDVPDPAGQRGAS